jgi:hypothetical protein
MVGFVNPPVKFNPQLFWDYSITEQDLEREDVLILYISKVLENGTLTDVKGVPIEFIEKYLDRLFIPKRVRTFWEWYLKRNQFKHSA